LERVVLKILSYLVKREGMGANEFADYYENHHVPLILRLAPPPIVYKRHYLQRGDAVNIGEAAIDFDVVTEQVFADRAAFQSWIDAVTAGDAGERVAADEARFLDRSRTRSCVVNDCVTTG
jgi:EthD domain-containing protein